MIEDLRKQANSIGYQWRQNPWSQRHLFLCKVRPFLDYIKDEGKTKVIEQKSRLLFKVATRLPL